ncbi:hypothetical protein [Thiorhodococcus fuscus]|uniref:Uncharacterized protein n=1 Tax=Thiorhodococcus fuscus TaxID=527200 RepID=A0ABW4Y2H2_9GAMM
MLVTAYGNSLRALVNLIDGVGYGGVQQLEIPTGVPLVYRLDADLRPLRHQYL